MSGSTDSATIAKAKAYSQQVHALLGSNAVGVWNFDEGINNTCSATQDICDISGYGNHGTVYNDEAAYVLSPINGYALSFDGVDDYVDFGDNSNWQNLTSKSVFLWVKPANFTGFYRYIYDGSYWSNPYGEFIVTDNDTNIFTFYLKNTLGNTVSSFSPLVFTPDEWTFIGYSWNGINVKYYKDGINLETDLFAGTLASSGRNLTLGKSGDGYSSFLGFIDEVRIYSKALSSFEIQNHYVQGLKNLLANQAIGQAEYNQRMEEFNQSLVLYE
jgi:hypothetical protein